ncbi:MAG: hypothetical protein WAS27_00275 [Candidatus Saccharimonadales bacterium]
MKTTTDATIVAIKTAQRIAVALDGDVNVITAKDVFDLIDMLKQDVPGMSDVIIWQALGYGATHHMFGVVSTVGNDAVILTRIDRSVEIAVVEDRMQRDSDDLFRNLVQGSSHLRDYLAAL